MIKYITLIFISLAIINCVPGRYPNQKLECETDANCIGDQFCYKSSQYQVRGDCL